MNKRFILLSIASIVLRVVGLLMLIGGVVAGFYYWKISHRYFDRDEYAGISAACALVGIVVAVFGEIIGVLFAIEENRRKAAVSVAGQKPIGD